MTAINRLQQIAQQPCTTQVLLAQGILWAEASCRVDGTMAMALRNSSEDSADLLLSQMVQDGIQVMNDVPRWLNANRDTVLATLAN